MSIKKLRGRTSFCRRIYHMCQAFLYDMSPSSSKPRPSPFSLRLLSVTGVECEWKAVSIDICDQCDDTELVIAADKPRTRRFFLNEVWFYSYHNSQYTDKRIRARNYRNNAPSWYATSHKIQRRVIFHLIWTLKTQRLLLLSHIQLRFWWCRWCVFSSRDCSRLTSGFLKLQGKVFEQTMHGKRLSLNLTRRTLQAHAQVNGTSAANFASSSDCGC